ncbi:hypothetical protein [Weissella confusa]|uniref:hypothetical protein n=1 Tax=Weissella confusa TaxID=1583 RepID=UPI0013DFE0CA|nr:hypothetical protein [Weissella confusa]QIE78851.1 hypothetical protein G4V46_06255 [Weissella confusa]
MSADGRFWVYKTLNPIAKAKAQRMAENGRRVITSWSEDFSFWSSRTVQRTINSLVESGFVLKGNFNKMKMDKTVWLTIDYERLSEEIADKARSDAYGQNVQMGNDAYGQKALMSRLWTGFFGTGRYRTPKIFQNPDFSLKRRDFWVFL